MIRSTMDEEILKSMAAQLRQPHGDYAIQVGEMMNQGNLHINLNTIQALQLNASDQVLEIGMGNGFFVRNVLSAGDSVRYTGCDFSEIMVSEAKKINSSFVNEKRAAFHLAGAEHIPAADQSFDKIFTINTIYFWENPEEVLAEIHRLLKSKGRFLIALRPRSSMQDYPFTKYGFNLFSKEELSSLLTANQFTVKEIIELQEPDQEIAGENRPVETLIVVAGKS